MNIRAIAITAATAATASLAAAVISASPAQAPTREPVSAPVTAQDGPKRPQASHPSRMGRRAPLKASPDVASPGASPKPSEQRPKRTMPKAPANIRITFYRDCSATPQRCIDAGTLTAYNMAATPILAGHNFDGYQWLSRVPVGRRVVVVSGPLAGSYQAYGHMRINRQGGAVPAFGGAALVLQSCEGSGTGFTLLRKV